MTEYATLSFLRQVKNHTGNRDTFSPVTLAPMVSMRFSLEVGMDTETFPACLSMLSKILSAACSSARLR